MRHSLRSALLLVLAILLSAPVSARERGLGWQLVRDEDGLCFILSNYRIDGLPDVEAAIAMTTNDDLSQFQISFLRTDYELTTGAHYRLDVSIDRLWQGVGAVAVAMPTLFTVTVPMSATLIDALIRGSTLRIHGRNATVEIALTGTRHAIPALIRCVTGFGLRGEPGLDPFEPPHPPKEKM